MDVRVGLWRKLSAEELMLLNCGVGEDSWESLGLQGDPVVNPKGNQPWIFTGRTDTEAEAPILWPPDAKNWLIGKDPDAGKDWRQEEKGMTEDEMVGWYHRLNGHEFDGSWWWTGKPGVLQSMGLQSQTRLSPWTELNWIALQCCVGFCYTTLLVSHDYICVSSLLNFPPTWLYSWKCPSTPWLLVYS